MKISNFNHMPRAKKEEKSVFQVVNQDGDFVREYSFEIHGEDAEKLAGEFAKKINGQVK